MNEKKNVVKIVRIGTSLGTSENLINSEIERQYKDGYKVFSTSPIIGEIISSKDKNVILTTTVAFIIVFEKIE